MASKKQSARPSARRPAARAAAVRKTAASPRKAAGARTNASLRKAAGTKTTATPRAAAARNAVVSRKPAAPSRISAKAKAPTRKVIHAAVSARSGNGASPVDAKVLRASVLEIVRKTSAELPPDVRRAIEAGTRREAEGSNALWAMNVINENIALAEKKSLPLCQDTGSILFFVHAPKGFDQELFRKQARAAVSHATEVGYLRQNSVDSVTGRNSGTNLGPGSPVFHFEQWNRNTVDVRLVLKGGGCENMGAQYSLPDGRLGAGRDLKGVEKVVLDAVYQAQGKGCGPGILGVCVGGDRATGYAHSKEQLLRMIDDRHPDTAIAELEERVVEKSNALGIGPMGFGGGTTLLGCKIGVLNRLPASYFVSISYMCWAYRRQGAELDSNGAIRRWLY